MKKVLKFVKGKRDDKKDSSSGITPSQSSDLISPAQTPEDERFLGLENTAGYFVDFCGKDKSLTKLHKAAWQGNLEKVKNALKKIDVDAVDRHNRTPLHFAVVQGHPNIVWFLLGNNARHTICDDEGRTALLKAVECGHKESMSLLLERGADINHADFSGMTSIHIVTKQGALDITNILIQRGADIDVANNSGEYPIHSAIRSQNKDIVDILLRSGASINSVDRENRTPLMLAAKSGNMLLAQLCIEYGAHLSVVDSNGWTAEDYAHLGGYQSVANEIRTLMKKDMKPALETHAEEDELDVNKSDHESTWNDSHLSEQFEPKDNVTENNKFPKFCDRSDADEILEKGEDLAESPGSGVVPPPCQPPRSWEMIEAGMIDEATAEGAEPKRRSITTLGSLHSRKESFTDNSGGQVNDHPRHTLSLNRRKDVKKSTVDVKQRFSFNEVESLKSSLSDDFSLRSTEEKEFVRNATSSILKEESAERQKNDSGSDWDSRLSSLLDSGSIKSKKKSSILNAETDGGTFGRKETMKEEEELWVSHQKGPETSKQNSETEEVIESSSWDSGESAHDGISFPPPPTELELGVDIAKSRKYMKGISIDQGPGCSIKPKIWKKAYEEKSHSMDSVDDKECDAKEIQQGSGKKHSRQPSISQKWHSVELPQQQRPANRLVDVNRRISEQLECYDQALRELAESPHSKQQEAIISTLKETQSSKISNYYSLPSSKILRDLKAGSHAHSMIVDNGNSLTTNFLKKSGLKRFKVSADSQSLPLAGIAQAIGELENNERLGFEEKVAAESSSLNKGSKNLEDPTENVESSISDELPGSEKNDRRSKRHMLLAMRDVKHAIHVTSSLKTSLEDHILSPLVKVDDMFVLSPQKQELSGSEDASPAGNGHEYFFNDTTGLLGRQSTVIECSELQPKSSPSDSGEEPTLWLQEKEDALKPLSAPTSDDEEEEQSGKFSPLGVVYKELKAECIATSLQGSCERRNVEDRFHDHKTLSNNFQRDQRVDSFSDNEDSFKDRVKNKLLSAEDVECSPDISFSSGPIEPLGNDSGSDPESVQSHQDPTPVHKFSLKKHHKWLKEKLQNENKERHQLEEVAAQLAEKAERLQYELADARDSSKSRDEIIALLQGQLARMEKAYTQSLEESVHCRLQLATMEQEIFHLKELCGQYEDERESKTTDGADKQCSDLAAKIRELEEEKEGLSRTVVRLEQENRTLERKNRKGEIKDDGNRWTERSDGDSGSNNRLEPYTSLQGSANIPDDSTTGILKQRNFEPEEQHEIMSGDLQKELERTDVNRKHSSHEEINQSILLLNKKNTELEAQLQLLVEELKRSKRVRCRKHEHEESSSNSESMKESEHESLNETSHKDDIRESHIIALKQSNVVLNKTIVEMKQEISRLKNMPNFNNKDVPDPSLDVKDKKITEVIDSKITPFESEEELKTEDRLVESCIPKEVEDLKKEVQGLRDAINEAKKGDEALESHINRLLVDGKLGIGDDKGVRENEIAWSNLYGMKHVDRNATRGQNTSCRNNGKPQIGIQSLMPLDKDSEKFIELKVRELEIELENAKKEIERQRLESNVRMQEILTPKTDHLKVFELKSKVLDLEREIKHEREARTTLDQRTIEIGFGLREKRKLEFELDSLKTRIQREFVPKGEAEAALLHANLAMKKKVDHDRIPAADSTLIEECETLAREQHRAEELERRLGREKAWNDDNWGNVSSFNLNSFSQVRQPAYQEPLVPVLDDETKAALSLQLEHSINRFYEGNTAAEETSSPRDDLLQSKFLS